MSEGLFPDWVGDIVALIAMVIGLPGIILFFLNKKSANRKLVVEEGGLTVEQFNAALPAYKDLLNRANADKKEAVDTMKLYKDELDVVNNKQDRLIQLFLRVLSRASITLTPDEIEELEATRPTRIGPSPFLPKS